VEEAMGDGMGVAAGLNTNDDAAKCLGSEYELDKLD
jgi:hypothetical protein